MRTAKSALVLLLVMLICLLAAPPAGAQAVGQIGGTVRNVAGQPLVGISVSLFRDANGGGGTHLYTDASGQYLFGDLPAGTYFLLFRDDAGDYAFEYFDDATDLSSATPIELAAGASVTADAELGVAGRIQGELSGPDGAPVSNGYAFIFAAGAERGTVLGLSSLVGGQYDLGGLNSGDYIVEFTGSVQGQYHREYYLDQYDWSQATRIAVTAGFVTEGIDGIIGDDLGGALAGTLVDAHGAPLVGIEVSLYRWREGRWVYTTYLETDLAGRYEFAGLQTGSYTLLFRDWSGAYAFQYYGDVNQVALATPIDVAGAPLELGAITMAEAGRISGQLTDPSGLPLENSLVFVFLAGESQGDALFLTPAAGGHYELGGLPTGEYIVWFTGYQAGNHFAAYYDEAAVFAEATPVPVTVGETTAHIDGTLGRPPGGRIEGQVTDLYGDPFALAQVEAYSWESGQWQLAGSTTVDYASGHYGLALPPGAYQLKFTAATGQTPDYPIVEYFDDVQTMAAATPVSVTLDVATTGIDAALGNFGVGSLSGAVTDESGQPIAGVTVYLYDSNFTLLYDHWAVTGPDGVYQIDGLWPAEYHLEFYDPAYRYSGEFYDDAASNVTATAVPVLGAPVTGIDAELALALPGQDRGALGGTVQAESGGPLRDIRVTVYDESHTAVGFARTASDGRYLVRDLPAGSYRVRFRSPDGWHVNEWYADQPDFAAATPVQVVAGLNSEGVDAILAPAGRLQGTITNPFGNPFALSTVTAYRFDGTAWQPVANDAWAGEAAYLLSGLPSGTYRLGFSGGSFSSPGRESEFYDDVTTLAQAADIELVAGTTVSGLDAVLGTGPAGAISGTVVDGAGQPLAGIDVTLYAADFTLVSRTASTDINGQYTVDLLYAGTYYVQFSDPLAQLPTEFYANAAALTEATPVAVNQPVTGIDLTLDGVTSGPGGGAIAGTVRALADGAPLAGIRVQCYGSDGLAVSQCQTTTAANGSYQLGGFLPAGAYLVRFSSPAGTFVPHWFDGATSAATATPITVSLGNTTANVDAELAAAGRIGGRVTRADGTTFPFLTVTAYRPDGDDWTPVANTTVYESPDYLLGGLPQGTYRLRFAGYGFNFVQTVGYYDGEQTIAAATDVAVLAGQDTLNIDDQLGELAPGVISGQVTGPTGTGQANILVQLLDADGQLVRLAQTDAAGAYTLGDLSPGAYYLYFSDPSQYLLAEYYDDAPDLAAAALLTLTEQAPVLSGIDAQLVQVGGIRGQLLDTAGAPPALAQIMAYQWSEGSWQPRAQTLADPAGHYQLINLPPGAYRLEFTGFLPSSGGGFVAVTEYYDNATSLAAGTDVAVLAGEITAGVDATLGDLNGGTGQIQGLVTANQIPLAGVTVQLYWQDGAGHWWAVGQVTTAADGGYAFTGLPASRYHLCFMDPAGGHQYECFDDSSHLSGATALTLAAGMTLNAPVDLLRLSGPAFRLYLPVATTP